MTIAIMTIIMTVAMDYDYDDDHERLTYLPCLTPPTYFFTFCGATLGRYLENFFGCSDYARLFPPRSKRDTR